MGPKPGTCSGGGGPSRHGRRRAPTEARRSPRSRRDGAPTRRHRRRAGAFGTGGAPVPSWSRPRRGADGGFLSRRPSGPQPPPAPRSSSRAPSRPRPPPLARPRRGRRQPRDRDAGQAGPRTGGQRSRAGGPGPSGNAGAPRAGGHRRGRPASSRARPGEQRLRQRALRVAAFGRRPEGLGRFEPCRGARAGRETRSRLARPRARKAAQVSARRGTRRTDRRQATTQRGAAGQVARNANVT